MPSRVFTVPIFLIVIALAGCQTYQRDLDRSARHYQENRHAEALALLEVLENDTDSLSSTERARYAYFRGMANFRLEKPREARHWLGRAAASEKLYPDSLSTDEKERVEQILTKLNTARLGGENAPTAVAAAPGETTKDGAAAVAAKPCSLDADCVRGEFCDGGSCRKAAAAPAPK